MHIRNVLVITGLSLLLMTPLSYAAEAAKTLFTNRCQGCHGPDGKGVPAMAKALQTNIPDLTSKDIAKKSEKDVLEVISKGKGKMPPTGGLSDKELKEIVSHVRSLPKGR